MVPPVTVYLPSKAICAPTSTPSKHALCSKYAQTWNEEEIKKWLVLSKKTSEIKRLRFKRRMKMGIWECMEGRKVIIRLWS